MRKALLIGDAVVPTGFAKANHAYIDGLQRAGWDVEALALNYHGDPHSRNFRAWPTHTWTGGDPFGMRRMPELLAKLRPNVLVVTNDPWNMGEYLRRAGDCPVVAVAAVDGKNCRGRELNGAARTVFWTRFGETEAKIGGYQGPSAVVPLGVDLDVFRPMDQVEARQVLPPETRDAFIVGVVGRNQPRKRIDLAMYYFAEWIKRHGRDDCYLFLQVAPTGDQGYDVLQLAHYLGIAARIIVTRQKEELGMGITEHELRQVYSVFDVMLTTTQGEGWGLCHMEGMACGVPQIVPDWAALGEWPEDAAVKVRCDSVACTPNDVNVLGGVMSMNGAIAALEAAYQNAEALAELSVRGLALVSRPEYRWTAIGDEFAKVVNSVFEPVTL